MLLHGTGGDETSLLPIAQELNKQATVLSIRGDVSENGMNRYFKRLAEGHYDLEDLEKRGEALHKFIQQAANEHQFSLDKIIFYWLFKWGQYRYSIIAYSSRQLPSSCPLSSHVSC